MSFFSHRDEPPPSVQPLVVGSAATPAPRSAGAKLWGNPYVRQQILRLLDQDDQARCMTVARMGMFDVSTLIYRDARAKNLGTFKDSANVSLSPRAEWQSSPCLLFGDLAESSRTDTRCIYRLFGISTSTTATLWSAAWMLLARGRIPSQPRRKPRLSPRRTSGPNSWLLYRRAAPTSGPYGYHRTKRRTGTSSSSISTPQRRPRSHLELTVTPSTSTSSTHHTATA